MRPIPQQWSGLAYLGDRTEHSRVRIANGDWDNPATWIVDLSNAHGHNFLLSAETNESLDAAVVVANVVLKREWFDLSLSPDRLSSRLNLKPNGDREALLQPGRRIRIETQLQPAGSAAEPDGTWFLDFDGYVDEIESSGATDGQITLTCRDLGARVQDRMIEKRQPPEVPDRAHPTWYETLWATWPEIGIAAQDFLQDLLEAELEASAPTLFVEDDPLWQIMQPGATQEFIRMGPLLEYLRNFAAQIGFDVRYRWNEAEGAFVLTLWNPPREYEGEDFGLPTSLFRITSSKRSIFNVRNRVAVWYADRNNGRALTLTGFSNDTDSQAAYGVRTMIPAKDSTNNIDSFAEASRLRSTILTDLSEPWLDVGADALYFPFAQLGDCVRLDGGHENWEKAKWLSIQSIRHMRKPEGCATSFTLRQVKVDGGDGIAPEAGNNSAGGGRKRIHITNMAAVPSIVGPAKMRDPKNIQVIAHSSTNQAIAGSTLTRVICDAEDVDKGNDYAAGVFVVPYDGIYSFRSILWMNLPTGKSLIGALRATRLDASMAFIGGQTASNSLGVPADLRVDCEAYHVRLYRGEMVEAVVQHDDTSTRYVVGGTKGSDKAAIFSANCLMMDA